MNRRLAPLTAETVAEFPAPCASCLTWEHDQRLAPAVEAVGLITSEKQDWYANVVHRWGHCGRLAYVEDAVVGYVTYAPAGMVPRAVLFPTAPVSPDAVLFMTGGVLADHQGGGIGRMLMQSMAKDLTRRGFKAVEAFASTRRVTSDLGAEPGCLVPEAFLTAVGFRVVRPHRSTPRLRLELRTALAWREDVEQALEKLLGTVRVPVLTSRDAVDNRVGEAASPSSARSY